MNIRKHKTTKFVLPKEDFFDRVKADKMSKCGVSLSNILGFFFFW